MLVVHVTNAMHGPPFSKMVCPCAVTPVVSVLSPEVNSIIFLAPISAFDQVLTEVRVPVLEAVAYYPNR